LRLGGAFWQGHDLKLIKEVAYSQVVWLWIKSYLGLGE